jgi:hypothetical protein
MAVTCYFFYPPHPWLKYRMRRRWWFWTVQEGDTHITWGNRDRWRTLRSYPHKAEAVAHLVGLKLQGHDVEL